MKLYVTCMACMRELGRPDFKFYRVDLQDNGTVEFECCRGHKSLHLIQSFKFELLAEVAVSAIVDGYYREAVSSFTSALERFFEFYIKIKLRSSNHTQLQIDDLWKRLSKQSERQLGAFNIVYMMCERELPKTLKNRSVEFRNKVVHQGLIPSREQAIEYGQVVADVINHAIVKLRSSDAELISELVIENLCLNTANRDNRTISTLGHPTLLNAQAVTEGEPKSVLAWLEHVEKMKNWH